jgi:hypothetical protein
MSLLNPFLSYPSPIYFLVIITDSRAITEIDRMVMQNEYQARRAYAH